MDEYDTLPWERCDITLPELADAIATCDELYSGDLVEIAHVIRERSDKLASRLAKLEAVAGVAKDVADSAESWDCSESWEHEGDCIDNAEPSADDCLRCYVVRTLRAALKEPTNG